MVTVQIHFTDYFAVSPSELRKYGAFNISLVNDLPLFIDPFLLFNSDKAEYQELHEQMLDYLRFLQAQAQAGGVTPGLLNEWFTFPEVNQNWFGFSRIGNAGRGLGPHFAKSLKDNLAATLKEFGGRGVTRSSHIEKLALIDPGVGRDKISDLTTNLIKGYLLLYSESFALNALAPSQRRRVQVPRARFNYDTETWAAGEYELPYRHGDYVILTPRDMLTRGRMWINRPDLVDDIELILHAVPDVQQRDKLNRYLAKALGKDPTRELRSQAVSDLMRRYPDLLDVFIKYKEGRGQRAVERSQRSVSQSESLFVEAVHELAGHLLGTPFYEAFPSSKSEALRRVAFLKDVIENKGGHRIFWKGKDLVLRSEEDLHILYRLTWFGTPFDVTREANDGRGPSDYKIAYGAADKTIVEFKLAKNTKLKRNLEKQAEVYRKAADAQHSINVIFYFTDSERKRARKILKDLRKENDPDTVLIDVRRTNKPSGSRA